MTKTFTLLFALLLIVVMSGCSVGKTDPNHQGLHYHAGPVSATKYANCLTPSVRNYDGFADKHYYYPSGQRTFSFTGRSGAEARPIAVTDHDGQEVDIPGYVTFTLTSNCALLRQFHERLGLKYHAYADSGDEDQPEGWSHFLNDYLETPLQQAMNKAAQDAPSWKALYTDTATQQKFEADVKEALPDLVTSALGGNYITINAVQISKPEVSSELKDSITQRQVAENQKAAQEAKNQTIKTQYDTIKDCLKTGLGRENCTLIYLEQSGADIPFLPVPAGGAVNYGTP